MSKYTNNIVFKNELTNTLWEYASKNNLPIYSIINPSYINDYTTKTIDYKNKYLKYKQKYLELKNKIIL